MSEHVQSTVRVPGLPPGVSPGPLGARFVAYLIDSVVTAVIGSLTSVTVLYTNISLNLITVVSAILVVAWALVVWWMFAVRAAGPGMRLMHLQLVGLANGRPIGWGRFFLRQLILFALGATGIGLVLMLVFLVMHPRRQGWHDRAVNAVVIKERRRPAASAGSAEQSRSDSSPRTAELPAVGRPDSSPGAEGPGSVDQRPAQPVSGGSAASPAAPQPLSPPPGYPQPAPHSAPSPQPTASPGPAPVAPAEQPPVPAATSPGVADPRDSDSDAPASPLQPMPSVSAPAAPPIGAPASADPVGPPARSSRTPGDVLPIAWRAVLDDGRDVVVDGLVLLGRNPQPRPGEEHAILIKIADTTRTVSKSHLEMGLNSGGLYVVDRGSTNGSTVTGTSGVTKRCAPGDPVQVESGSIVSLGDHWLEVRQD